MFHMGLELVEEKFGSSAFPSMGAPSKLRALLRDVPGVSTANRRRRRGGKGENVLAALDRGDGGSSN